MYKWAFLLIIGGAALWGTIGIFVQGLYDLGFSPIEVVAIRVIVAFFVIAALLLIRNPSLGKVNFRHLPLFFGTGIMSIVFFNWAYFTTIQEINLSVAAVLLYTGPAFVTIMSRIFFREAITGPKVLALCMTLAGCTLVIGLFPVSAGQLSVYGIVTGVASGFGYALYSIFGKTASRHYSSLTITFYTFLFASAAMLPFSGIVHSAPALLTMEGILLAAGLGTIPTVFAYLLYTAGLNQVESSRASIAATVEPVVAALIGLIVFADQLTTWQFAGMALVLLAVLVIQKRRKPAKPSPVNANV
ncbi:DMT family transporter [Alteribacter natronophilus]|uniref:DMT family transporter n=1 Tax=Alteribacter natronophilus TaxID=2583810 RepID=UPI00110E1532|nr:DMT family transporter [Alteribacter natronophilus]TMW71517.1 EamA family transporter [Alteribacter natronophilus]